MPVLVCSSAMADSGPGHARPALMSVLEIRCLFAVGKSFFFFPSLCSNCVSFQDQGTLCVMCRVRVHLSLGRKKKKRKHCMHNVQFPDSLCMLVSVRMQHNPVPLSAVQQADGWRRRGEGSLMRRFVGAVIRTAEEEESERGQWIPAWHFQYCNLGVPCVLCVCICIHMCMDTRMFMYGCECIHTDAYMFTHVYTYVYILVYVCVYAYVCMYHMILRCSLQCRHVQACLGSCADSAL